MNAFDFLTIWGTHAEYLVGRIDWTVIFGAVLIVGAILIFWRMTRARGSSFDFAEMFQGEDGRTSMAKFLGFVGGLTATWVIVSLQTTSRITEGYFGIFLGIMVAGKVASEYVAARKVVDRDKASAGISDNPAPTESSVDLAMTVTKGTAADPPAAAARAVATPRSLVRSPGARPRGKYA